MVVVLFFVLLVLPALPLLYAWAASPTGRQVVMLRDLVLEAHELASGTRLDHPRGAERRRSAAGGGLAAMARLVCRQGVCDFSARWRFILRAIEEAHGAATKMRSELWLRLGKLFLLACIGVVAASVLTMVSLGDDMSNWVHNVRKIAGNGAPSAESWILSGATATTCLAVSRILVRLSPRSWIFADTDACSGEFLDWVYAVLMLRQRPAEKRPGCDRAWESALDGIESKQRVTGVACTEEMQFHLQARVIEERNRMQKHHAHGELVGPIIDMTLGVLLAAMPPILVWTVL